MQDIKLVVCDLDGTLLKKDEIIPDFYDKMHKSLQEKNVAFTIATGRSSFMVRKFLDQLQIKVPYILNNGGMIMSNGKILFEKGFRIKPMKEGLYKAMNLGMSVMFVYSEDRDDTVMKKTNWTEKKYVKFGSYSDEYIPTEDEWNSLVMQKITIVDKMFHIERVTDMFADNDEIDIIFYDSGGVEIVSRNVNKANAVVDLSTHLQIPLDQIMSIGNDMNDIEMLKVSGIGVCVSNAVEDVKQVSDFICEREYGMGVAEAINKFVLENNQLKR